MTDFAYHGRNTQGELVKGVITAENSDEVADKLIAAQIIPVQIKEVQSGFFHTLGGMFASSFKKTVKREELITFCRQMSTLYKAGVPITHALERLTETAHSHIFVVTLQAVASDLHSGVGLAQALRRHPQVFPELMVNVIDVGENTGQLEEAFLALSGYLEQEQDTVNNLKASMRYPMIVIVAVIIAIVILNIFVIPVFAKMFSTLNGKLPLITRGLIATSDFMVHYGWMLLGIIFVTYCSFKYYIKTPKGQYQWERLQLKVPLFGHILQMVLYTRFAHIFALVVSTDIALPRGIELVASAVGNAYMAHHIRLMGESIAHGASIVSAATQSKLFTPIMLQMLTVGEETGEVAELLQQIAVFYTREVDFKMKRVNDYLEPVLLVFVAILVIILALGIFMPMWNMSRLMMH